MQILNSVTIRAIFLDMTVDAPARAMWQAIKQFNGYCGCGRCKETGEHLDLGPGKKNSRCGCHVYPFNKAFASTTGHMGVRKHDEVKEQALEALKQRSQGKKNVSLTLCHQFTGLFFDDGILSSVHFVYMYELLAGLPMDCYWFCLFFVATAAWQL